MKNERERARAHAGAREEKVKKNTAGREERKINEKWEVSLCT